MGGGYTLRMAYRGEDAGDVLEAETLEGKLEISLGANRVALTLGQKSLHLVDRVATVVEVAGKNKKPRRTSHDVAGLVFARGVPREDVGIWIEARDEKRDAMRRIFGISPVSLFEDRGLKALAKLDLVATRLRGALEDYANAAGVWYARAVEIGGGHPLDKVLFADFGDHHAIYARKLFRDRARLLAHVHHADGRIVTFDGKSTNEVHVTSRFGITVRGDYLRFADEHGTDLARVALPWVGPEDRDELARRIGQLVHRS
jgi:hypothetical protein